MNPDKSDAIPSGGPARWPGVLTAVLFVAVLLGAAPGSVAGPADDVTTPDEVLSDYAVAVYLLESGATLQAIPHLESAWEGSAHDQEIGQKLADAYFSVGELDRCDEIVDELMEKNDKSYDAPLLKAKITYIRGDKEEALELLHGLKDSHKMTFEVERVLGKIYYELGRDEEALEAYGNAIRIGPGYPMMLYKYGLLLRSFDRGEEAIDALRRAIALEPDFTAAAVELADALIEASRYPEAEEVLLSQVEDTADHYEALLMLGTMYMSQGELSKGIRLLEMENLRRPLPRDAVVLLGQMYYEAKEYDEALAMLGKLFESEGDSAELARILGEISLRADENEQALRYYRRAIEIAPNDYRSYLALYFASSERFAPDGKSIDLPAGEAARLLELAAQHVEDGDFNGLYLVGISYQSVGADVRAHEFLERAYGLRPEDERVLLNLASVLESLRRYEEAEVHLATLYEMQPDDPTVCNFYGYLLALMGKNLDKAEALVKMALKHEPENGYYIDSLGWVYYKRGEFEKALAEIERAAGLVVDDPVILEHLGDVYRSLNDYHRAVAAYEKSRALQGDTEEITNKISAARQKIE